MSERVIFVAEAGESLIHRIRIPQRMISDLLEVSRVPLEAIDQIGTAVEAAGGFLDDTRLAELVRESVHAGASADAVVGALQNLRPSMVQETLDVLERWRNVDSRNAARFPDEAYAAIRAALPRLVRPSVALDRYRKAERLRTLTGHQARSVEILCDARPIFDSARTMIEGFVTQITLKMVYETQTEETECLELVLDPDLLDELLSKADIAKKKLDVLRDSVRRWLPDGLAESPPESTAEEMR